MNKAETPDKALAEKDRVEQQFEVNAGSDSRVRAWLAVAGHPFFYDCYDTEGKLLDAVLAALDAAHAHTREPVWRPVTPEEIQPGWEVRTRRRDGSEMTWGVAHHQFYDGDWRTDAGTLLTCSDMGWTYETTAPKPKPGPEPEQPDWVGARVITVDGEPWVLHDAIGPLYIHAKGEYPYLGHIRLWDELVGAVVEVIR